MLVRKMIVEDLDQVCALERLCFPNPWMPDMFEAEMEGPAGFAEVVIENGELAGYTTYRVILDEAHLMNIAIDPGYRGGGLGKKLLRHVMRTCVTAGAEWMYLEVRPSNTEALGLYESHGFKQIGVRKKYYANGEDALLMAILLERKRGRLDGNDGHR